VSHLFDNYGRLRNHTYAGRTVLQHNGFFVDMGFSVDRRGFSVREGWALKVRLSSGKQCCGALWMGKQDGVRMKRYLGD
jgi:hypothetical protein